jgi:hypothetical protein
MNTKGLVETGVAGSSGEAQSDSHRRGLTTSADERDRASDPPSARRRADPGVREASPPRRPWPHPGDLFRRARFILQSLSPMLLSRRGDRGCRGITGAAGRAAVSLQNPEIGRPVRVSQIERPGGLD